MLKLLVPLVFLLFADGTAAGGKDDEPAPAAGKPTDPAVAPDKADPEKAAATGDKATTNEAGKAKAHAGAGGKKPTPKGDGDRVVAPPPGISAGALRDEMGVRAGVQKAATERERLEALSSDLIRTRTALREETTRLEGLMDKAKQSGVAKPALAGAAAGAGASAPGSAQRPGGEGGPMPLGDPLAPNAYYRPAPPPPNFAVQVEVVSKAMKSMKPEQAAGILGHLERGLAAEVLQRMRPADAGAILGFLKPEVGAALAAEIVSRPPVTPVRSKSDKEKP